MAVMKGGERERAPRLPRFDEDPLPLAPATPPTAPDAPPVPGGGYGDEDGPTLPPSPLPPSPDDPLAGLVNYGPTPSNSNLPLSLPGSAGGTFTTPDQPGAAAYRQRPQQRQPSRLPATAQTGVFTPSLTLPEEEGLPQRLGKVMFNP